MSVFCDNSQAPLFCLSFIRTLLPSRWNPNKNTSKKIFAYAHGPCWFQWVLGFQMFCAKLTPCLQPCRRPMYEKRKTRCLKLHGYNRTWRGTALCRPTLSGSVTKKWRCDEYVGCSEDRPTSQRFYCHNSFQLKQPKPFWGSYPSTLRRPINPSNQLVPPACQYNESCINKDW